MRSGWWRLGLLAVLQGVCSVAGAEQAAVIARPTRVYWGDTHLHTSYSFDVYLFGAVAAIPDTAYRFARGLPDPHGASAKQAYVDLHGGDKRRSTWHAIVDAADPHNQPGGFAQLVGWGWSSQTQGGKTARQSLPFSALESSDPEALWKWLGDTSARTGAQFLAIPHNANLSDGRMFPLARANGQPIDADYARARARWEPLLEVTQIKGDSEAHPGLSPDDGFANYEACNFVMTVERRKPAPTAADYARSGLRRGLELEALLGVNPYQFGLIGSSDSHTGMSAVEETAFGGKSFHDAWPGTRGEPAGLGAAKGWDMGAAGFVAAWASENTRQGIFESFQRREVYASTGPRISLRFFAGFDFVKRDAAAGDLAALGYRKGVPMGGVLARGPQGKAPTMLVAALKDPLGANLDRVQIIQG